MATLIAAAPPPTAGLASTPPIPPARGSAFYGRATFMALVLTALLVPVLWILANQPEAPVSRAEWLLLTVSAFANVAVIAYHYLVPAHPKFLVLPGRLAVLLVHIISGSVALVAGVLACFFYSREAAIVQACAALFFHVPSAYLQVRNVFGSQAIMYPAYLLSITLHGFCAAMLLAHPDSHRWAVNTFLVFNIYTWCRVYFYLFDRMKLFASMKYTISIFAAGVTMLPSLLGSMTMLVLTGFVLAYIVLQRVLFIRTPTEYFDFVREKSREGVQAPDLASFWGGLVGRDQDERVARSYFELVDAGKQGYLDRKSLLGVLAPWGLGAAAISQFTDRLLAAGPVGFERFLKEVWSIGAVRSRGIQIVVTEQAASERDRAELVFRYADADRDGGITVSDLEALLVEWGLPVSEAARYLAHGDRDGDGRLSFDEFFTGMRPLWRFVYYEVFRAQLNRKGTDDMIGRSATAMRDKHRAGGVRRRVEHELLSRVPFLAQAKPELIADLSACLVEQSFRAGEVIFREGEAGDKFLIVSSGIVRVSRSGATLADLGTGGCVGEGALLSSEPRNATVTALRQARLFALTRASFQYLTEKYPAVREQLQALHTNRLIISRARTIQEELMEQVSFLRGADSRLVHELAAKLVTVRYLPGEVIIREGDPGESFFIIEQGETEISRGDRVIERLGVGGCFGEGALFSGQPRIATVVATVATRLFRLDKDAFTSILNTYPEVRQDLLALHASRSSHSLTAAPPEVVHLTDEPARG
jgi:CRP-like cAMP-binding protein/Ca2+-binding EF-hand superfamily protein